MSLQYRYIQKDAIKLYDHVDTIETEKIPPLIEPGSVNRLANLAIPALKKRGFTITILEDSASGGELVSSLTIQGSGEIVNKSVISPDLKQRYRTQLLYKDYHGVSSKDPNAEIKTLTNIPLSNFSNKKNNISLVTLGDFNKDDHVVHIGLRIKNKYKFISLTQEDYNTIVGQEGIQQDNVLSVQKQFVADQALRLLLRELKADESSIVFQPQIVDESVLNKTKNDTLKLLLTFLSGRKIALAESAPGGYMAKTLTDIEGGLEALELGQILYNTNEKVEAGVSKEDLAKDNLYGRTTASALARIAKNSKDNVIGIGVTGLLDTEDSRVPYRYREPGVVYYTILIPGLEPITDKIHLPNKSRLEMKAGLTLMIYQRLLQVLIQDEMASL